MYNNFITPWADSQPRQQEEKSASLKQPHGRASLARKQVAHHPTVDFFNASHNVTSPTHLRSSDNGQPFLLSKLSRQFNPALKR